MNCGFGTGKNLRYLTTHQIAASLGPEMSCSLPTWSSWKSLPKLTNALFVLADESKEIPNDAMNIIESFVILLFDRTSTYTKVDRARRKLFP